MAKKSNNKIELKYTKEDLLWEATRRNELYREEFQNVIDNPKTLLLAKIGNNLNFEKDEDAQNKKFDFK